MNPFYRGDVGRRCERKPARGSIGKDGANEGFR